MVATHPAQQIGPRLDADAVACPQMAERVLGRRGTYQLDVATRRAGGQAEVFRAVAPGGATVAVRLPRSGDAHWFERECTSIADVTRRVPEADTWLAGILDRGTAPDGRPFVVMPWFQQNLSDWLRTDPPLGRRLAALELACRAVVRLHQCSAGELDILVHRDLKPSNFLIDARAERIEVRLTDLGAARAGAFLATAPNTLVYTRSYAPPEQQLPVHLAPDPTVDVHALGVTVFVGLADRVPTAALSREGLRTEAAQRLLTLDALGCTRTTEEDAEHRRLVARPIGELLDLEGAVALFPSDEATLRSRLVDRVADTCTEPDVVVDRILAKLLPALRRALEPDAARRLADARTLQAACRHAAAILREYEVQPLAEEPSLLLDETETRRPPPILAPPPPPRVPTRRRPWWPVGAAFGGAGLLGAAAWFLSGPIPGATASASVEVAPEPVVAVPSEPPVDVLPQPAPARSPALTSPPQPRADPVPAPRPKPSPPGDPPSSVNTPVPAASPPEPVVPALSVNCPGSVVVKVDGHRLRAGESLSPGDHAVWTSVSGMATARSTVHVAFERGAWQVTGPWVAGNPPTLICPT